MIVENMDGVICIMQNKDSVLGRKWAKETPNELWAELEENLWAKHYALSAEVGNIWNWLEWGGFEDFSKQNIPILTFFFYLNTCWFDKYHNHLILYAIFCLQTCNVSSN